MGVFSAGLGCPSPLYLLIAPRVAGSCTPSVRSNAYFLSSCELAQQLITATQGRPFSLSAHNLMGISFHPSYQTKVSPNVTCIDWDNGFMDLDFDAYGLLSGNGLVSDYSKLKILYQRLWKTMV